MTKLTLCFIVLIAVWIVVKAEKDIGAAHEEICKLPKKTGPCRGFFHRWFYNADDEECQKFVYGGCHGNDNNFATKKDCEYVCLYLPTTTTYYSTTTTTDYPTDYSTTTTTDYPTDYSTTTTTDYPPTETTYYPDDSDW